MLTRVYKFSKTIERETKEFAITGETEEEIEMKINEMSLHIPDYELEEEEIVSLEEVLIVDEKEYQNCNCQEKWEEWNFHDKLFEWKEKTK
jgi:hypothetical protein